MYYFLELKQGLRWLFETFPSYFQVLEIFYLPKFLYNLFVWGPNLFEK